MVSASMLDALLSRRSVSPKRLCGPGPSRNDLDLMVDAALRAPDHAGLLPWRLIEFRQDTRVALADLFEQEKRRRDPIVNASDIQRAREHALHAPVVLGFVMRAQRHVLVPVQEQWLCAGAALGNLLTAAHALGYGAIMLSGERCQDEQLRVALDVKVHEVLAGFVSMGSIAKSPPTLARPPREQVLDVWQAKPVPATDVSSPA